MCVVFRSLCDVCYPLSVVCCECKVRFVASLFNVLAVGCSLSMNCELC